MKGAKQKNGLNLYIDAEKYIILMYNDGPTKLPYILRILGGGDIC